MNRLQRLLAPSCLAQPRDFAKYFGRHVCTLSVSVQLLSLVFGTLGASSDAAAMQERAGFQSPLVPGSPGSRSQFRVAELQQFMFPVHTGTPPEYFRNSCRIPPEHLQHTSRIFSGTPEDLRRTSRNTAQPPGTPPEYLRKLTCPTAFRNTSGIPPYRTASRNTSGTPPGIPHSLPEHLRNTPGTVAECLRNTSRTPPASTGIPHSLPEHLRNTCGTPPGTPSIKCLRQAVPLVLTVRLGSFARRCRARRLGGERPFAEASSPET